jgi:hypothetical protein
VRGLTQTEHGLLEVMLGTQKRQAAPDEMEALDALVIRGCVRLVKTSMPDGSPITHAFPMPAASLAVRCDAAAKSIATQSTGIGAA